MHEAPGLILAGVVGLALGAMFFGGLWWSLRKALASPRPALWFVFSPLLRMGMALAGFYFVSAGDWRRIVACLVGFAVARIAITRLTRPAPSPEAIHAAHS